jgi:hypothetical protein
VKAWPVAGKLRVKLTHDPSATYLLGALVRESRKLSEIPPVSDAACQQRQHSSVCDPDHF